MATDPDEKTARPSRTAAGGPQTRFPRTHAPETTPGGRVPERASTGDGFARETKRGR